MKSTTFALSAFLASLAVAQPHAHQAFHNHEKRDDAVVWVTEVETATDIVDVTTTIWVSAGYIAPTIASSASTTSVTPVAAQFFQAAPSSATPATTLSTSTYVAPTPSTIATTSSVVAAAVATTSSVAPVATTSVAVVSSSTSSIAAAATTAASTSGSSVGSTTGTCDGESNICAGDITYYDTGYPGYGACGDQTDGTKVAVIALPYEFMGTLSNNNPYCHRNVSIQYKGVSITAMVVDKCMGCDGRSIDLSHFAFDQLADEAIGRTQATWYFLD